MSEFMFGVSRRRLNARERAICERIAREHGADLIECTLPGTGYQRWFTAPNLGEPFDSRTALAVRDAIAKRGVAL